MTQTNTDNPSRTTTKLKGRQVDLILRQMESVPTLPEVATRLLNLTASRGSEMQEIIGFLRADQSLTARILSLANRADAGIRKEARTVGKAVVLLGLDAVRSAVLSIKVFEMFGKEGSTSTSMDRREFWKHSLAVACASQMLARSLRLKTDPEELFICGLLHDVGKVALEQCLPKSYARVVESCTNQYGDIAEYERRILGVDHTVAGRRLAQQWHLPEMVEHAIWLHHQPIDGIPEMLPERRAIAVVHLADTIAREQRFGYSGNFSFPASSIKLATQVGISAAGLDETIQRLPGAIEKRCRILGMGETTSESLYRSALANANLELGRLNRRLHRRASRAGVHEKAFTLLHEFGVSLSGQERLSELCQLLARTWAQAEGLAASTDEPVAAYVFSTADRSVILGVDAGSGDVGVDMLPAEVSFPPPPPPAVGAPGADVLRQLFVDADTVPDALSKGSLAHYPLVCGSQWVGGLLWSAGAATTNLSGETAEALAMSMAFAAKMVETHESADNLAEQLAQSSQRLYAAQKALAEARALAAVGEMAAGAAHEVNNPLAVIAGRAQLMAESAPDAERQTWRIIVDQAGRISDIITEMMEFARPEKPQPQQVSARSLMEAARQVVYDNSETRDLDVEVRVAPNTPQVFVDPEQIIAVLAELMTNARAAYESEPHVRVEAGMDEGAGKVLLRVADQGSGMDAATLDKAFTPFFSAHPAGRRRGLGLSKARRVLELAGGKIWIASTNKEGTSVFVHLPPAEDSAGPKTAGEADL